MSVDTLEAISSTIDVVEKEYNLFTADFYHEFGVGHPHNLKKYTIDEALNDSYFMDDIIPKYLRSLMVWPRNNIDAFRLGMPSDLEFRDRIKLMTTIVNKMRSKTGKHMYVAKVLNDFFGARIILRDVDKRYDEVCNLLEDKHQHHVISRYYLRNDGHYRGIHCYFQDENTHLPWELQIWDKNRKITNYNEHERHEHERGY